MKDLFPEVASKSNCDHRHTRTTLTPELQHYAREDCALCGKFLRWLKKPETVEREKENAKKITQLRDVRGMCEWEKGFMLNLDKQGTRLSPRQQEWLDKIWVKYGHE